MHLLRLPRLLLYLVLQVQVWPQAQAKSSELGPQPARVLHLVPCPKYSASHLSELPGHLPRASVSSDAAFEALECFDLRSSPSSSLSASVSPPIPLVAIPDDWSVALRSLRIAALLRRFVTISISHFLTRPQTELPRLHESTKPSRSNSLLATIQQVAREAST